MPIFAMPQLNITFFLSTIVFVTMTFLTLLWIMERTYLPRYAHVLKTRKLLYSLDAEKKMEIENNDTDMIIRFVAKVIKNINISK